MSEKMYWAARCRRCDGMVGYKEVTYRLDVLGVEVEESLPEGTMTRRCSHCGEVSDFDLRQLRSVALRRLVQKTLSEQRPRSALMPISRDEESSLYGIRSKPRLVQTYFVPTKGKVTRRKPEVICNISQLRKIFCSLRAGEIDL